MNMQKIKHNMTKAAELITLTYAGRRKEVNSDTGVKDLIDKHPFHTNYGEVIAYKMHYTKCTVLAVYRVHTFSYLQCCRNYNNQTLYVVLPLTFLQVTYLRT